MWFISDPWKQTSHSIPFVFWEASTNIFLLENKNVKLVSISVPGWNTHATCISPEPSPELPKLRGYLRGYNRELRLEGERGATGGGGEGIHCGWEQQHTTAAQNINGTGLRVINCLSLPWMGFLGCGTPLIRSCPHCLAAKRQVLLSNGRRQWWCQAWARRGRNKARETASHLGF